MYFAVAGGLLISLSTSLHLLTKGRVTGMSGIFYSLISLDKQSIFWKGSLVSGMLFISSILMLVFSDLPIFGTKTTIFDPP